MQEERARLLGLVEAAAATRATARSELQELEPRMASLKRVLHTLQVCSVALCGAAGAGVLLLSVHCWCLRPAKPGRLPVLAAFVPA